MPMNAKRKQIQELVIGFMNAVDKTKFNGDKYKKFFDAMTDEKFDAWAKKFFKDDESNFYMEILPYKNEPLLEDIMNGAKYLNIPLEEYIYYRHDGNKDDPMRSAQKVPVGYLHIKRLQQILSKKNSYSVHIDSRNSKTNQLSGDDKVARITDAENFALNTYEAEYAMKEFFGPRADNSKAKSEMLKDIATYGYVQLDNLSDNIEDKQTLNTIDTYFLGSGIKTDLVTDTLLLKSTTNDLLSDRKKRERAKDRFEDEE